MVGQHHHFSQLAVVTSLTREMVSPTPIIILPFLLVAVNSGCSFKNQMDDTQSVNKDLDAAKYAAKMAIAHKGLDIETLKKRQARYFA